MDQELLKHPGRMFVPDRVATKRWAAPITVDESRTVPGLYRLRDGNGVVIRKFKRLRYAKVACAYLCALRGEPVPTEDDVVMQVRQSWFEYNNRLRAHVEYQREMKRRKRGMTREKLKQERQQRAAEFWGRVGLRPLKT